MPRKGINRYRPDRREELLEKARIKAKEQQKRDLIKKRNNYKIRDSPLDNRI
jgi:hypothetical protein